MSILLKLDYAKFGVSNLIFFQKLSKKNLAVSAPPPPPLGKERVKLQCIFIYLVDLSFEPTSSISRR